MKTQVVVGELPAVPPGGFKFSMKDWAERREKQGKTTVVVVGRQRLWRNGIKRKTGAGSSSGN